MSRRKFVAVAAGAAAGAGVLAYLGREKLGFGDLPETRKRYAEQRDAQRAEYERTGTLPDVVACAELILLHDQVAYMERGSKSERMPFNAFKKRYDAFSAKVLADAAEDTEAAPAGVPQSQGLEKLLRFKRAFQKQAGTTYNRDHDALPDPLLERRYQCRSGTLALEMLALHAAEKERVLGDGETLVSVYTDGHVEPGLLLKDETLVALEMTSAGSGVRNFGKMASIKGPIRVVRADHALYQEALDTDAHRERAVLYETVTEKTLAEGRASGERTMNKLGRFGFGEPKVPSGDIPMSQADMLPADDVFDEARLYNRMERVQSEEEVLQMIPDAREREFVRNYMVHHRTLIGYHNNYIDAFNRVENLSQTNKGRRVSLQEFQAAEREMLRLTDALEAYARANELDAQYAQAQQILSAHGKTITTVSPSDIARVMRSNLDILRRSR